MRSRLSVVFAILIALGRTVVFGQDFSGSYSYRDATASVTLTLKKGQSGEYRGLISSNDAGIEVTGTVKSGVLTGKVGDALDGLAFEARLNKGQLSFIMVELNEDGSPIPETAQTYVFLRASSAGQSERKGKGTEGKIVINDLVLSDQQVAELSKQYNVKPLPGRYWYDALSGLYGVVGYPAFGFMLPGHQLGKLKPSASQGNSKVFINGRELPLEEYTVWSQLVGSWIQPGKYWLDAAGNAGQEGNPTPLINLYAAARQSAAGGKGGGGDNFWTSRFSAGNSDSDGSRGYVSVPGHGPVGYGF